MRKPIKTFVLLANLYYNLAFEKIGGSIDHVLEVPYKLVNIELTSENKGLADSAPNFKVVKVKETIGTSILKFEEETTLTETSSSKEVAIDQNSVGIYILDSLNPSNSKYLSKDNALIPPAAIFKKLNFTYKGILGGELLDERGGLYSLESNLIVRVPSNIPINNKNCAEFGAVILCPSQTENYFLGYNILKGDKPDVIDLGINSQFLESYREDLILGCSEKDELLNCKAINQTDKMVNFDWTSPIKLYNKKNNFIKKKFKILAEEHLVYLLAQNGSMVGLSARNGDWVNTFDPKEEIESGIGFVKKLKALLITTNTKTFFIRTSGKNLTSLPNCINFVPGKEICLECEAGYWPSRNRSACYKVIEPQWYKLYWGEAQGHFLFVKFWFKTSEEFFNNFDESNIRATINGKKSEFEQLVSLEDVTNENDKKNFEKKFKINYLKSFSLQETTFELVYKDNIGDINECPDFDFGETRLFENLSMPSWWKLSEGSAIKNLIWAFGVFITILVWIARLGAVFVTPCSERMYISRFGKWLLRPIFYFDFLLIIFMSPANCRGLLSEVHQTIVRATFFRSYKANFETHLGPNSKEKVLELSNFEVFEILDLSPLFLSHFLVPSFLYGICWIVSLLPIGRVKNIACRIRTQLILSIFPLESFFFGILLSSISRTEFPTEFWLSLIFNSIMLLFTLFEIILVYNHRTTSKNLVYDLENEETVQISSKVQILLLGDVEWDLLAFDLRERPDICFEKHHQKNSPTFVEKSVKDNLFVSVKAPSQKLEHSEEIKPDLEEFEREEESPLQVAIISNNKQVIRLEPKKRYSWDKNYVYRRTYDSSTFKISFYNLNFIFIFGFSLGLLKSFQFWSAGLAAALLLLKNLLDCKKLRFSRRGFSGVNRGSYLLSFLVLLYSLGVFGFVLDNYYGFLSLGFVKGLTIIMMVLFCCFFFAFVINIGFRIYKGVIWDIREDYYIESEEESQSVEQIGQRGRKMEINSEKKRLGGEEEESEREIEERSGRVTERFRFEEDKDFELTERKVNFVEEEFHQGYKISESEEVFEEKKIN